MTVIQVQYPQHLVTNQLAPNHLSLYGMKQVTILRIDSVSDCTASPAAFFPAMFLLQEHHSNAVIK